MAALPTEWQDMLCSVNGCEGIFVLNGEPYKDDIKGKPVTVYTFKCNKSSCDTTTIRTKPVS